MLEHRHTAAECGTVFAAFGASESPLRHQEAASSCHYGGQRIWHADYPRAVDRDPLRAANGPKYQGIPPITGDSPAQRLHCTAATATRETT